MAWEDYVVILKKEKWITNDQADETQRKETCFQLWKHTAKVARKQEKAKQEPDIKRGRSDKQEPSPNQLNKQQQENRQIYLDDIQTREASRERKEKLRKEKKPDQEQEGESQTAEGHKHVTKTTRQQHRFVGGRTWRMAQLGRN